MKKTKLIVPLLFIYLIFLSACGNKVNLIDNAEPASTSVKVKTILESRNINQEFTYPAIVSAGMESRLSAQMPGTIAGADFEVGDTVSIGQVLAQINEFGSNKITSSKANSNQIKQAIIGTQQAQESYQLARSNYENIVISSARDLEQASIARDQASSGVSNLDLVNSESFKSAQLAFETAQLASEQASNSLENKKKTISTDR